MIKNVGRGLAPADKTRYFMNNGYCEKKEDKDCNKCFRRNDIFIDNPPCKYYILNNKGYNGTLKDIDGVKIRRQWFFTVFISSLYLFALLSLAVFIVFLIIFDDMAEIKTVENIISMFFWCFIIPFEILLLILSCFNLKFFGKTVAVLNDDGVYTNQVFLKWREITEIEFFPHEFRYRDIGISAFVKISSKKGTYKIAHMPLLFLYKAKKYNPAIRTKMNKEEIKGQIIVFVACIIGSAIVCLMDL